MEGGLQMMLMIFPCLVVMMWLDGMRVEGVV